MKERNVHEAQRVRDAHAARFDYELNAIFQDIKAL
jgi:hypothetical protein